MMRCQYLEIYAKLLKPNAKNRAAFPVASSEMLSNKKPGTRARSILAQPMHELPYRNLRRCQVTGDPAGFPRASGAPQFPEMR